MDIAELIRALEKSAGADYGAREELSTEQERQLEEQELLLPATEMGEELADPAPPQPRPPPLQSSSPALRGTVPCPVLMDTWSECLDLQPLVMKSSPEYHQLRHRYTVAKPQASTCCYA
ncbi:UNVERIFIED_CONTAM: hypothetical protein FKN15_049527 [Acipenser sinensis]